MSDAVNKPAHYHGEGVECIDAIRAALGQEGFIAYCRGNAIKYAWRAGKKHDNAPHKWTREELIAYAGWAAEVGK